MKNRAKERFKKILFGILEERMYKRIRKQGHYMVHATTWKWREKCVNEKYWCRNCHMEAFIQLNLPKGLENLHGPALFLPCTNTHKEKE
ncbi:MAG: hypothetical protein WC998_00765 [Candidatus Paceibacterota bacterium]|jgi:hypothetical protein